MTPRERVESALRDAGSTTNERGLWRCPVSSHGRGRGDMTPSLSVSEAADGTVLVNCWAGCETADLLRTLGLEFRALFPSRGGARSTPRRRPAHAHTPRGSVEKSGDSGLTLDAYARATGCTREFLAGLGLCDDKHQGTPAVRIPYLDPDGQEIARRWRVALKKGDTGPDARFRHRKGDKLYPYGLWRLKEAHLGLPRKGVGSIATFPSRTW